MEKILSDATIRTAATRESLSLFFGVYLPKYISYEMARMHDEILNILEDKSEPNFCMTGFRSCGKSSIGSFVYPIWAILGRPQKKYVLLVAQTQPRAKQLLNNIRSEFEGNDLLRNDLGEFRVEGEEWQAHSLLLPKYGAKISAVSIDESIRGIRHRNYRPDLIIFDDIEDLNSVKTAEGRDKTSNQIKGQFLPAGDKHTRYIFIGNHLHEDSAMMRLKKDINEERLNGIYRSYPLLDANNICQWPGKYPTPVDIENERKRIGNKEAWMREMMLIITPSNGQIIPYKWINFYTPNSNSNEYPEE